MKKKLAILFILLVLLKIILSLFIQFPLGYSDSLTYQESAKTFFDTLSIIKMAEYKYPLLYPLLITPAFIFENMETVMTIIQIINSILSSLIIFPVYLFSKEFLNKKKSFLIAAISAFIPPFFIFTFTSMSENLFYPLFLLSIYFIYKSFKENSIKWNIIAGLLIGLTLLTKILAIILIPLVIVMLLLNLKQYKEKIILLLTTGIISLFWIIPRIINYGFNFLQASGYQPSIEKASSNLFLTTKFIWFFLYIDYLILSTGIILFLLAIFFIIKYKKLETNEKLFIQITFLAILFLLIVCANHSGGFENYQNYKTLGRYIEGTIPLIIILGFIELERKEKFNKIIFGMFSIFTIISSYFILFDKFFPINNSSLTHIGILKFILDSLLINSKILILGIFIVLMLFLLIKQIKPKKVYLMILAYFLLITIINISVIYYETQEDWLESEGAEIGKWINENLDKESTFLFDKKDLLNNQERPAHIATYWIRGNWKINEINDNYDYIITTKKIDKEIVYIGNSGTKIYKT